jgi:hypothetical protein
MDINDRVNEIWEQAARENALTCLVEWGMNMGESRLSFIDTFEATVLAKIDWDTFHSKVTLKFNQRLLHGLFDPLDFTLSTEKALEMLAEHRVVIRNVTFEDVSTTIEWGKRCYQSS